MNIDVFTVGQLQDFMALAATFEAEGVTDLRFVRQRIQDKIANTGLDVRRQVAQAKRLLDCPECGFMMKLRKLEGVEYLGCCKCHYSKETV